MSPVGGMQDDHLAHDEHRHAKGQADGLPNGMSNQTTSGHHDRQGRERVKRKISRKDFAAPADVPNNYFRPREHQGTNGSSFRHNNMLDLNDLQHQQQQQQRQQESTPVIRPQEMHHGYSQKTPTLSNYNFDRFETQPTPRVQKSTEDLTGERRRHDEPPHYTEHRVARDKESNGRTGHEQDEVFDRQHRNNEEQPLRDREEPRHHRASSRKERQTKDRSAPSDKVVNGYYERDTHRIGSAFSSRWTTHNGGDVAEQELDRQQYQHQEPPANGTSKKGGEYLTIRDILDNQELRSQISELRRSQNSSVDVQQQQHREQERITTNHGRTAERDRAPSARHHSNDKFRQTRELVVNGTPHNMRRGSAITDASTDDSLLERKYRPRQAPVSQMSNYPAANHPRRSPLSGPSRMTDRTSTAASDNQGDHRSAPPSEQQRRDLYHSSYSPSDFSPSDDQEDGNDEEGQDGEQDQDTVELQRTIGPSNVTVSSTSPPPHLHPPSTRPPPVQAFPSSGNDTQPKPQTQIHPGKRRDDHLDDPGYDSGEISFEREVAFARARRELGASADKRAGDHAGAGAAPSDEPSDRPIPRITTASRLDHGRDLALEDLVSPTRFNFGARQHQQQQQQQEERSHERHQASARQPQQTQKLLPHLQQQPRAAVSEKPQTWRSAPGFPLLSTTADLAQLDIVTAPEDHFMELAGSLGEGQAVASVLGTLKAMIRQLKSEKKDSMKANKALQKDLQRKDKELERTRKANEKLSRKKDVAVSSPHHHLQSKHEKERARDLDDSTLLSQRPIPSEEREQETKKAGIQKAKDLVEKNLQVLQKRIDALEVQRAEMQNRERRRAEEEADLLFLIDSEADEDEDEETESENETDTDTDTESEESDRAVDAEGLERNEHRTRSHESNSRSHHDALHAPRRHRSSSTKRPSGARVSADSSSKPNNRKHRTSRNQTDVHPSGQGRSKSESGRTRSKSANPETRRIVEKVEEVHIHHHVHYGEENKDVPPVPSRSRSIHDDRRALDSLEDNVHRLHIGTAFRPHERGSVTQQLLEIPPLVSGSALSRSLPGQRSHLDRPVKSHHNDDEDAYPPIRIRAYGSSSLHGADSSTRVRQEVKSGGSRVQELTAALKNPTLRQKKLSIDVQRILSLLKTHDPQRCTVCCHGGDGQEHHEHIQRGHYQYHQPHQQQHGSSFKQGNRSTSAQQQPSHAKAARAVSSPRPRTPVDITDTESSLSSVSDDDSLDLKYAEDRKGGQPSYRTSQGRKQPHERRDMRPPVQQESSSLESTKGENQTPEQKLHLVLSQLEEEVQQLRTSYFELSRDLEALGHSTDAIESEGNSGGSGSGSGIGTAKTKGAGSSLKTSVAKPEQRPEILKEQLRQKKMIRRQLEEVADSLAEKADLIMRLHKQSLKQRQQQQQQQQQQHSDLKKERRKGPSKDEPNFSTDKQDEHKKNSISTSKSTGQKKSRRTSFSDVNGRRHNDYNEHKEDQDAMNEEEDKDEKQGSVRQRRQQHGKQRADPLREHDEKTNEDDDEDEDEDEAVVSRDEHDGKAESGKLKEPEGYRHRLANGFRVPRLQ